MKSIKYKKLLQFIIITLMLIILSIVTIKDYENILQNQIEEEKNEFKFIVDEFSLKIHNTMTYIFSIRGFVYSQLKDGLTNEEFDIFAKETQIYAKYIKNFSVAPDNIQTFVFPLKGNELTLHHNLETDEREQVRLDVQKAMTSENIILSGPYELRQGGLGMVVRTPIYDENSYWGLVNAVVDVQAIIDSSEISNINNSHSYAISNKNQIFWQNNEIIEPNIEYNIQVANNNWIVHGYINKHLNHINLSVFIQNLLLSIFFIASLSIVFQYIFFRNSLLSSNIKNLIYNDILTSLPNRRSLEFRIDQLIKSKTSFALAFIDLNNFKTINDTLGHNIGDKLLIQISKRINTSTDYDTFRWGGDEFIILCENITKVESVDLLESVIHTASKPLILDNEEFIITSSVGISFYPDHGNTKDDIIKLADAAMYIAKKSGKNSIKLYTDDIGKHLNENFNIERKLEQALKDNELEIYYQPQYNIKTNQIEGLEALIRWKDKNGKFISPSLFIPIAEQSNLINRIDEFVLIKVANQMNNWKKQNIDIKVAINISANHFSNKFKQFLSKVLNEYDINPSKFEIEITETVAIENFNNTKKLIEDIRLSGIGIALDDFGTGYSSLSHLSELNISTLKIDLIFISKLSIGTKEYAIVKSIIAITKSLNIKTVAEGVETIEQLELLRNLDCDFCQGYLFSKPIPVDEITLLMKNNEN